jgi:5-dehydro-2-deoxygluconokinase
MIEIIAGKHGAVDDDTIATALTELYDAGLKPDWWKLEPQASGRAWANIDRVIETRDPYCRGVVLLGLEASQEALERSFATARSARSVRGFAVGRTIFADAARRWLLGEMSDDEAVADMAQRFEALTTIWLRLGETAAA